jgi:hypothetical protein
VKQHVITEKKIKWGNSDLHITDVKKILLNVFEEEHVSMVKKITWGNSAMHIIDVKKYC